MDKIECGRESVGERVSECGREIECGRERERMSVGERVWERE